MRDDVRKPWKAAVPVVHAARRRASESLDDAPHRQRLPSYPTDRMDDPYGSLSSLLGITLADAVALAYTNPLWSILVSVIFLGEPVRIRRWTATVAGFLGVLCIVRPTGQIDPAMLVALGSAVSASLSMMIVKKLTTTESPYQILFFFTLVGSVVSLGPGIYYWQTPSLD